MDGLLNFFSPEAGQRRRANLDEFGRDVGYYVPPELRSLLGLVADMSPTATLERAGQATQRAMDPSRTGRERIGDVGAMLSETAAIAAPVAVAGRAAVPAARAAQEGLLGFSMGAQDLGRTVIDRLNQPGPMPTLYSNPLLGQIDQSASGIRAYHGSPHDFDRFSMGAIGTGEGAQAYGPGLYFAEAEPVARGYRDMLTARAAPNDARGNAFDLVQRMGGDIDATAEILRDGIANTSSPNTEQFLRQTLKHLEDGTFGDFERPIGRMYEVNINANPEDFIDYDAPLSAQSENVQRFANERWQQIMGRSPDPTIEGEYILKMASPQSGIDSPDWLLRGGPGDAQRERLLEAGIPGVRYLDAGSRGAGDGSRNLVVFDENLIEIVRKYGVAGAATLLGLSVADIEAAMAAPAPDGLLAQ